jgi:hypothetical protein
VCFGRCQCDATLIIDADVEGLVQPGNYLLARLNFSRQGFSVDCTHPVWPLAEFESGCGWPPCANPGDPRATLIIRDTATNAEASVETFAWGRVKSLYR